MRFEKNKIPVQAIAFCAFFFVLLALLFFASAFAKKRRLAAISASIKIAVEKNFGEKCEFCENVPIPAVFSSPALLFSLSQEGGNSDFRSACLMRETGFSGPAAILLVESEKKGIFCAGALFDGGELRDFRDFNISEFAVEDAKRRFAKILGEVVKK